MADTPTRSVARGWWVWLIGALMVGLMAGWIAFQRPAPVVQAPTGTEVPSLNGILVR